MIYIHLHQIGFFSGIFPTLHLIVYQGAEILTCPLPLLTLHLSVQISHVRFGTLVLEVPKEEQLPGPVHLFLFTVEFLTPNMMPGMQQALNTLLLIEGTGREQTIV